MKQIAFLVSIGLILLLFLAFSKKEISVTAHGKVFEISSNQVIPSVEVFVEKRGFPEFRYFEPTNYTGTYRLQYNVKEGRPVALIYRKKGYTTFRQSFLAHQNYTNCSVPNVHLLKLHDANSTSYSEQINFKFFPNKKLENFELIPISKVAYFEFIQQEEGFNYKVDDQQEEALVLNRHWYKVNFMLSESKERISGWIIQ